MSNLQDQAKTKMNQALEHLKQELKNIRTGRANPSILEGITVEVYGARVRLKEVANISTPEPRQLLITPFDANNAGKIRKDIEAANIGLQPILDGNAIRINIAPMDQSQREERVKLCHKKREECKVSIRNVRRDSNELARKLKSAGELAEDALKREEKQIQELTDKFCKMADDISEQKEKEIMVV
jgi:ribosome recycling factor